MYWKGNKNGRGTLGYGKKAIYPGDKIPDKMLTTEQTEILKAKGKISDKSPEEERAAARKKAATDAKKVEKTEKAKA